MTNPTRKSDAIEFRMGEFKDLLEAHLSDWQTEARTALVAQVEAATKQAREDTFNLVRDALHKRGQDDRWTFLQYCLNGWIESGAQGFLIVEHDAGISKYDREYVPGLRGKELRPATVTAINVGDEDYDDRAVKMILESGKVCTNCGAPLTQKDGTWVDRTNAYACPSSDAEHKPEQAVFEVTHETIELGLQRIRHATNVPDEGTGNWERNLTSVKNLGQGLRNAIIEADLTNEATQLDVWGYSMIVEVACFGEGMYS